MIKLDDLKCTHLPYLCSILLYCVLTNSHDLVEISMETCAARTKVVVTGTYTHTHARTHSISSATSGSSNVVMLPNQNITC